MIKILYNIFIKVGDIMYYKKTVILTEEGRRTPPIKAQISHDGNFFKITLPNTFTVCLCVSGETLFSSSKTSHVFNLPFSENFCMGAFFDNFFYYGFCGTPPLSRHLVKNKHNEFKTVEINKAYDDEALSTENYFEYNDAKEATFVPIMREKGHFFKNNEQNSNQQSTIYPQCVKIEEETRNVKNDAFFKICDRTENKKEDCKKEEKSCPTNVQNDDGIGANPTCECFYKKIENDLHSLFCRFPKEEHLEAVIPNSTFVKIDYDKDKFYVTGVTTYRGEAEYIVFGVYAKEGNEPKELKNFGYFAPCFKNGDGYYLIYQDALTGEILPPT